jgi:hypothetical protein
MVMKARDKASNRGSRGSPTLLQAIKFAFNGRIRPSGGSKIREVLWFDALGVTLVLPGPIIVVNVVLRVAVVLQV